MTGLHYKRKEMKARRHLAMSYVVKGYLLRFSVISIKSCQARVPTINQMLTEAFPYNCLRHTQCNVCDNILVVRNTSRHVFV